MSPPPSIVAKTPVNTLRSGLRRAAAVIFLTGVASAEWVLWEATRRPPGAPEAIGPADFKAYKSSDEYLFGSLGRVTDQIGTARHRPGPRAGLILAVSGGLALVCLALAHRAQPLPHPADP